MKNRAISMTLAAIMLISLLASCGEEATSIDTAASDTTTEAPVTTDYVDALADVSYDGYEFLILGESMRDHYTAEGQTGDVINDAVYDRNNAVEERHKVTLSYNIIGWGQGYKTIEAQCMADEHVYDLVTSTHQYLGGVLTSAYLVDWNEIPGVDLTKPYYIDSANKTYSIGGKNMLLFGDMLDSNITASWVYYFNKRLAEDYKIEGLYDTVRSGSWTVDYFRNLIKDINRDLNGDAILDETDFYGFCTDNYGSCDSYTRTFGMSAISKDENDYPYLDFYKESTVDAYGKVYQLYFETPGVYGKFSPQAQIASSFSIGKSIFSNSTMSQLFIEEMRNMEDDYGILPYPKLTEEQDDYYTYLDGTYSAQMVLITAPVENYERTGIITEALNAYSRKYVLPAIYDTSLKVKVARDEDSSEMLDVILAGRRYSFDSFDERGFSLSPRHILRDNIQNGVENFSSYYAANKDKAQAWIDNMITVYMKAISE